MGTQLAVETGESEHEIDIRPFREEQDHEKMNVNVKSLVSIFEQDDGTGEHLAEVETYFQDNRGVLYRKKQLPDIVQCSAQFPGNTSDQVDHLRRRPERVIDDEDPPVTLLAVKRTSSKNSRNTATSGNEKDGNLLLSHPHFIKNNIVTKYVVKEKIGHDLRRCYSDSWGTYGVTDDVALLEALKDVIDKPQVVAKSGKCEKKSKRIRLPKKHPAPAKPFQEQVKDIFNPNKVRYAGAISSDSENDSDQSCTKIGLEAPVNIIRSCKGSCQGNYNVLRAAGGFSATTCPVCHCSFNEASSNVEGTQKSENITEDERAKSKRVQATADVVNIVLVEGAAQQSQWSRQSVAVESKPPKVSKRHRATVERKVFEVCTLVSWAYWFN